MQSSVQCSTWSTKSILYLYNKQNHSRKPHGEEKKVQQGNTKLFLFWHALVRQLVKCVNTSMHIKDYLIKTFPCACLSFSRRFKRISACFIFSCFFIFQIQNSVTLPYSGCRDVICGPFDKLPCARRGSSLLR